MKKIALICCFWLIIHHITAQLFDDFSDGDLVEEPTWFGDTQHFIVNDSSQLQLQAPGAGKSTLCTLTNLPDSIRWHIFLNTRFAPSASNKLKIYLLLDTNELTMANGYYFEIGRNGDSDPLDFYSLENGKPFLLGSSMKTFQGELFLNITVLRDTQGNWTFYVENEDHEVNKILSLSDIAFDPQFSKVFCIECIYTSSRTDKFIFDDINVGPFTPDTVPPFLKNVKAIGPRHIALTFNENIGSQVSLESIRIDPSIGFPIEIQVASTKMQILIEKELTSGELYTCSTFSIPDTANNLSELQQISFEYIDLSQPAKGDIAINEILFDPKTGGSAFIELYNTSDKYFDCLEFYMSIEKDFNVARWTGNMECLLRPNAYLVLTNDRATTISDYPSNNAYAIVETTLPGLSRTSGSIVLRTMAGSEIDSAYYHVDFHHISLNNTRGVTLERISPVWPAENKSAWNSASTLSGWGTPGLPNSQFIAFDSVASAYQLENAIFSPDGDGYEDFLLIRFEDAAAGNLVNARVYDAYGREVSILMSNALIGRGSTIKWDGTLHGQELASTGIYILLIEMMQESGLRTSYKEAIILATGF